MHSDLLDILAAPAAGGPLRFDAELNGREIESGTLVAADGTRFPIREGVPRMVPAEQSSVTMDEGATQRSFGAKWAQYREDEKDQLADFQYRWFDERFGFAGDAALQEFLADKRRVLDAGTGPGLCAARCARLSEARVVGMDLSESVTAAHRRHAEQENLDFVQGDILNPPFAPGTLRLRGRRPGAAPHARLRAGVSHDGRARGARRPDRRVRVPEEGRCSGSWRTTTSSTSPHGCPSTSAWSSASRSPNWAASSRPRARRSGSSAGSPCWASSPASTTCSA